MMLGATARRYLPLLLWLWRTVAACREREQRDEPDVPGDLRLIGVANGSGLRPESVPLELVAAQLREVLEDDCARTIVHVGGDAEWGDAGVWLNFFNHSTTVWAVDAVSDVASLAVNAPALAAAANVRALTALVGNVTNSREELVSTDVCLEDRCFVRARTLEDIWQYDIRAHLDVVTLDLGAADMEGALRGLLQQRGVSMVVCRMSGDSVTAAGLRALAEAAAAHDYFALLTAPCHGKAGPSVTYEPIPETFDLEGDQLMVVLDLRIPDLFQLIPLGDDECGVEDDADPGGPPGPVEWIRVVDEAPRSLVIRFAPPSAQRSTGSWRTSV